MHKPLSHRNSSLVQVTGAGEFSFEKRRIAMELLQAIELLEIQNRTNWEGKGVGERSYMLTGRQITDL